MIIFPAILGAMRSRKDKTFALTFETNELPPDISSQLMGAMNEFGYVAFKAEQFRTEDRELLENLKADSLEDNAKTPSQRLRAVLFRNWEQNPEGYKTFEDYYRSKYEIIITHYKGKLE